jgi:hypothetical protein
VEYIPQLPLDKLTDAPHEGHVLHRRRKLMINPFSAVEEEHRGGRGARGGIAERGRQPVKRVDLLAHQAEPLS